jgi:hypothetical protein
MPQGKIKAVERVVNRSGALQIPNCQLRRRYNPDRHTSCARKSYEDFLTLWKDADPDIPIYKQAKAEYARPK